MQVNMTLKQIEQEQIKLNDEIQGLYLKEKNEGLTIYEKKHLACCIQQFEYNTSLIPEAKREVKLALYGEEYIKLYDQEQALLNKKSPMDMVSHMRLKDIREQMQKIEKKNNK